jgi:ribosomal protein L7/L12
MNQTDFIAEKHASKVTIMETIKAVMKEYGMSLGEAKTVVSNHPAWATTVSATQPLHDDLERLMREKGSSSE